MVKACLCAHVPVFDLNGISIPKEREARVTIKHRLREPSHQGHATGKPFAAHYGKAMPFFSSRKATGNQAKNQSRRRQPSFMHHDKKKNEKRARAREVPEIKKRSRSAVGGGGVGEINAEESGKESASTNKLEKSFGLFKIL